MTVTPKKILPSALAVFFAAMVALGAGSAWAAAGQPFREGEKLVYRAKWGFISAGEVVMEVLPAKTLRGGKDVHFAMSTRTSSKIDISIRSGRCRTPIPIQS